MPPPLADTERSMLQTFSNCTPYSQSILNLTGLATAPCFARRLFSLLLFTPGAIWHWVATLALPIPHSPQLWKRHFLRHWVGYRKQSCFSAFHLGQVQGGHTLADKALVLFGFWPQMAAYSHKAFCNAPSGLPRRGSSAPPRLNLLQHTAYCKYWEVSAANVLLNTTQVVFTLNDDFKQYII